MAPSDQDSNSDTEVDSMIELGQRLITAILERAPLEEAKTLIVAGAPLWYQDGEGTSALHAAAYVESSDLVRLLIDEGALWNAVDNNHITAGDIALSYNDATSYTVIRNAGIRSELLLALLSSRSPSADSSLARVLKATDVTPAGSTDAYLSSRLKFTIDDHGQEICLLRINEEEEVGVMMGWEREIMEETVHKLCDDHKSLNDGLKVLNIGFGLGIIDGLFQALPTPPSLHVIIEAHPDVLRHMRNLGWYDKKEVKILEGKWQDFIESEELLSVGGFDVVYTDTFSEDYKELHRFFGQVPDLLAGPDSCFGFFNGLGATNALFYDVYTHVSDLHLADVGIDVEWNDVEVTAGSDVRWGATREYFVLPIYRLPIGKMRTI
ncbi:hypothetical protein B0H21DRAFT_761556 [Amylocystis lapponica]|nr:hypothetical protein B0H21DRAFT_761556 [Amylocystis lapponica]